ncbi:MAG: hypothetical protein LBC02_01590 [Planctomycetaceae bacterium]|jgi:hypothetical protein|nr:hypothetical protein [Planctomycetaceae bacterium]
MNNYFGLIILVILFVGCAQQNPYDTTFVEGTVQLDGVPTEGINVNFTPIGNGNSAGGLTNSSGKYKLTTGGAPVGSGAIAGEYHVTFSKMEIEGSNLTFEEYQKQIGSRPPKTTYIVPKKYDNFADSGIAPVTIEKGKKNIFDFDLSTK